MNKSASALILSLILSSASSMAQIDSQSAESLGWATSASRPTQSEPAKIVVTPAPVTLVTEPSAKPNPSVSTWTAPTTTPKIEIVPAKYKESEGSTCTSWDCSVYVPKATLDKQMRDINDLIPEPVRLGPVPASTSAATQKVAAPKTAEFNNSQDRFIIEYADLSEDSSVTAAEKKTELTVTQLGKTSYADAFMSKRHVGLKFGKYRCAEGLRNSLEAAGLVKRRTRWQQRHAKNWGEYLTPQGFKNMGPKSRLCKLPGVIRVYGGAKKGYSKGAPGDTSGHVEMVGTDGKYYSSGGYGTVRPINERIANGPMRRPLKGCYIKETELL